MMMNDPSHITLMPAGGRAITSAVVNNKVTPKFLFDDGYGEVLAIRIDGDTCEVKIMLFIAGMILSLGGPELSNCAIIRKDMSHESAL